ncbi:hypothetical protein N7478_008681 [Penicillium angulare]|uniref:uncharacterized protein n=1 Tax=Penicillium angulare TaxID=116970 RepID=UPI0025412D87|nr:uncharacterized protein N7478_008681 [Penicillium angulare]KAJ5273556.1 hypothetical protein N7478_008681 [Penicillium angulare]
MRFLLLSLFFGFVLLLPTNRVFRHRRCGAAERSVHRLLPPSLTADADYPCAGNVGGRTAWSSTVTILQSRLTEPVAARYWYDGQYINNAKEDAAEVALKLLNQQPRASTVYPGQLFPQGTAGYGRGGGGF